MTDTTDLIQRLSDEADLCRNDGATDIAGLLDDTIAALEQQGAQIAMLEQRATCGCGDQFTAHDPGTCGNCCAAADRSNEIEALRADAERMRGALNFIAEHMCSDWSQRCQAMVNTARAALRQEQPT